MRSSIYERPHSPHWCISYWCPKQGKRVHEVTPWRVDSPTGKKHALRYAAEKDLAGAAFASYSKRELWDAWARPYLEQRYRAKPKTLTRYLGAWDNLRVYLAENGLHHPQAVDYEKALGFLDWRTGNTRHCGKQITRNTAITELKILGVVMGEAVRRGYCAVNPCVRMGLKRDDPAEKPEMTDEEIALIRQKLSAQEGALPLRQRWMTIAFEIAIHHGCRLSETQVSMSAIDLKRETIRFRGKGGKVFTVKLHPGIIPLVTQLKKDGAAITCQHPPMNGKAWWTFFKSDERLRHLCFHCTRVTVITRLARAGVPVQQAMAYVGHSDQAVHKIYQRLKADDLTACTQAIAFGNPQSNRMACASLVDGGTGVTPQTQDGQTAIQRNGVAS